MHPFYNGTGRTSKILFANKEMINLIDEIESTKMMESQKN